MILSKYVKMILFPFHVLVMLLFIPISEVFGGETFFYKAELLSVDKTGIETVVRVSIQDLLSGVTITYDKNSNPIRITWSETRGISDLKIIAHEGMGLIFPKNKKPGSIVMIGISRPKDFINKGKWYFNNVEWHGFIEVPDDVQNLL